MTVSSCYDQLWNVCAYLSHDYSHVQLHVCHLERKDSNYPTQMTLRIWKTRANLNNANFLANDSHRLAKSLAVQTQMTLQISRQVLIMFLANKLELIKIDVSFLAYGHNCAILRLYKHNYTYLEGKCNEPLYHMYMQHCVMVYYLTLQPRVHATLCNGLLFNPSTTCTCNTVSWFII